MSTSLYFLGLYNLVTNGLKLATSVGSELFNATCNFLNGSSSEWYFFNETGPLPSTSYNIPTQAYRDRIRFTYNNFKNTLVQSYSGIQPHALQCKWLSTQLVIDGKEYNLEEFIQNLYVVISDYATFTVRDLVDAWSIKTRIWPAKAELHIVDEEGQSHVFNLDDHVNDEWTALLPVFEEAVEYIAEEEEETEEEEAEEEEEEDEEETDVVAPPSTPDTAVEPSAPVIDSEPASVVEPVPDAPVEPPTTATPDTEGTIETVTVTLDNLAQLDIAHLSGC